MTKGARAAAIIAASFGAIATGDTAHAAEAAVQALNGRVGAGYVWTHIDEDSQNFVSSALGSDSHQGFLSGTLTVPLGQSLGLRLNLLPNYGHRDSDSFFGLDLDSDFGGLDAGGDLFWRDPDHFEVGVEARYSWQDVDFDSGADGQTVHSFGGQWYGAWFLSPDAFWPIDLDAYFSYAGIDLNKAIGDRVREEWSVGGDVRLYPLDVLAFSVGGLHRELDSHGFADTKTSGAVFGLDGLLHRKPGLTLGPRFEVGQRDSSTFFGADFSQTYYSLLVRVTMSFPGSDSLVELNRNYY